MLILLQMLVQTWVGSKKCDILYSFFERYVIGDKPILNGSINIKDSFDEKNKKIIHG